MQSDEQDLKEIARRYVEAAWNEADVDTMEDVLTEQQVYHDPTGSGEEPLSEFKSFILGYHETFPDLHFEVDRYIQEDDYVAFWGQVTGTHEGPFMGIEPTGETIDIMGINVVRVKDGKVAERWANFDLFGILQQIGHDPLGRAEP
ncbi:ester cyclase [Natrinema sp. SYSU A 869]|uniref:ester cyclase n=1 Tax=Natrinema sp. SYSU A 869 TaxID=2871694 RepID=UPI001CA4387C|nr:ester cyclase [Natrinema sp. SYSU A 869]